MGTEIAWALADALEEAGLSEFAAVFAGEPTPDAPEPPDGPWVLVEYDGQVIIGGSARGEFCPYEAADDAPTAIRLVIKRLPKSVKQGHVKPWFEQPGGAVQYHFDEPIKWYLDNGYLVEVQ